MKLRLLTLSAFFTLISTGAFAQIDTAAVIAKYYKDHGWGLVYQAAMAAERSPMMNPDMQQKTEAEPAVTLPITQVSWSEVMYDFGDIGDQDSVKHIYTVTNVGKNPLYIREVKPSCGCTGGNFTHEAIPPGGKGIVELKFSPQGKTGLQSKSATVIMNTEIPSTTLTFTANIKI
jgi:Protein of unknown function (DUF1573)